MDSEKHFRYVILPELKLILEIWVGNFDLFEIISFKNKEAEDTEWRDFYNVLANDRFSLKKIPNENENFLKESQKLIKKRKTAILTQNPKQIVVTTILKLNKPAEAELDIESFSTLEAALTWLNVPLSEVKRISTIFNIWEDELVK